MPLQHLRDVKIRCLIGIKKTPHIGIRFVGLIVRMKTEINDLKSRILLDAADEAP